MKAAAIGRLYMVKRLIENGVDPRNKDVYGLTPLDKAIIHNNVNVELYLRSVVKEADEGKR